MHFFLFYIVCFNGKVCYIWQSCPFSNQHLSFIISVYSFLLVSAFCFVFICGVSLILNTMHLSTSHCALSSFLCYFVFLFFFSFVWSLLPSSSQPKPKPKLLKHNKNPTQWMAWPNKIPKKSCTCSKIQPTNQNPQAHRKKSSAIAPAPPPSW